MAFRAINTLHGISGQVGWGEEGRGEEGKGEVREGVLARVGRVRVCPGPHMSVPRTVTQTGARQLTPEGAGVVRTTIGNSI